MAEYIDKDALVAEIKRKGYYAQTMGDNAINRSMQQFYDGMKQGCIDILSFIDTLEVKEADLEKELIEWHKEHFKKDGTFIGMSGFYLTNNSQMAIAKHFIELGLSSQLSWQDVKRLAEIGETFMNSEESDNLSEEEYYTEILNKFKAKEGGKV